jgi:type II secretory pathway component PulM
MKGDPTITELEERIAVIRQNIAELVEQAAAFSGSGDEARAADRIAEQEQELARLIALRDARSGNRH